MRRHPAAGPIIAMIILAVASLVSARALVEALAPEMDAPPDPAAALLWDVLDEATEITRQAAERRGHGLE